MITSKITGVVKTEQIKTYPYIGKSRFSDLVVLFTSPLVGTVLRGSPDYYYYDIGKHQEDWIQSSFDVLEESITLTNAM